MFACSTAGLGYMLWHKSKEEKPVSTATTLGPSPTLSVLPNTARAPEGEVALESKGYIIPAHQILISPQVSGRIEKLIIEEGRRVQKGDVLAVLESTDYRADHERAQAMLRVAQEKLKELTRGNRPEEIEQCRYELKETEENINQLKLDVERNQKLQTTRSISERELQQSESQMRAMQQRATRLRFALKLMEDGPRIERIDLARAEVSQAESELVKAKWRLDNCTILAPRSGTILKKNAEEGNIVNPIAFNGSFSLCEMADLSDLEVDLSIQERDISKVFQGQRCYIKAEAFPDRRYEGVVSRLMPIADRAKGAVPVRVKLTVPADEEGVYLKPEMGAVVSFLHGGPKEK
jgi:HlyD family secretion protein